MSRDTFNQKFFQFIGDTQKIAYEITSNFQPEGLTPLEYTVLEHLYHFEEQPIKSISSNLLISESRIRKAIKQLINYDYLIANKDVTDGRRKVYLLTRKGKLKLDECYFQVTKSVRDRFKNVEDQKIKYVEECLDFITKTLYE